MKRLVASVLVVIALATAGDAAAQTVPSWCTGPDCNPKMFNLKNCKDVRQTVVENDSGVGWKAQNTRLCFFRVRACRAFWNETKIPYDSVCPDHSHVPMVKVCCDAGHLPVPLGVRRDCTGGGAPGFIWLAPDSGPPTIYQDPTSDSPVVGNPPDGARVFYTQVQQRGGQSWYFVHPPSGTPGWVPGGDISCARPTEYPEGLKKTSPGDTPVVRGSFAYTFAARG